MQETHPPQGILAFETPQAESCSMPRIASLKRELGQWFTPSWAAEAIVEQKFGWLEPGHRVLEPSCGDGVFLCAIPSEVEAVGVEVDPDMAELAGLNSGRRVLAGNFLTVPTSDLGTFDAIIGNPPFEADLIAHFLDRSASLLRDGGQAGFILPAYVLQTSSKVERLGQRFTIQQDLLPRNLFPRLKLPLVFAVFTKEQQRRLFGFLLYKEAQDVRQIDKGLRELLTSNRTTDGSWFAVVDVVLQGLGGEASLDQIYAAMVGRRPTVNAHWRAKVRQVLQHPKRFRRVGPGRYQRTSVGA